MAATESALRSLLTELFPHAAADVVLKENLIHLGGILLWLLHWLPAFISFGR